ncbi:MAG: histidine phosphatase family protein [Candidatus Thorarchaeota archaeon]|jgi:broad specificity phosphatase PhoE
MKHGKTAIDRNFPVHDWPLTEEGLRQVEALVSSGIFDSVDSIFSSTEPKAMQTAQPFADRLGIDIVSFPELRELDRAKGGFLSKAKYQQSVKEILNRHAVVTGWELRENALSRFQSGIMKIMSKDDFDQALLISHGLVLSMHFADLLGVDDVFSRWQKMDFCAWGSIQNNMVIKDIV